MSAIFYQPIYINFLKSLSVVKDTVHRFYMVGPRIRVQLRTVYSKLLLCGRYGRLDGVTDRFKTGPLVTVMALLERSVTERILA